MSVTYYASNQILDYNFGKVSYSAPNSFFVGLSTTAISTSGSNATEPVGASYARVEVVNNKSNFAYASNGCLINVGNITFPESSGSWGTILDVALWDTLTSGSIWYYTTLSSPKIVQTTTTVSFSSSALAISIT